MPRIAAATKNIPIRRVTTTAVYDSQGSDPFALSTVSPVKLAGTAVPLLRSAKRNGVHNTRIL